MESALIKSGMSPKRQMIDYSIIIKMKRQMYIICTRRVPLSTNSVLKTELEIKLRPFILLIL